MLLGTQKADIHIILHIHAFRLVEDTDDDILKMEMDPLVESLTVSGQHVLLATQKLSIQPEIIEHREELIEATQNVLLGVVKVMHVLFVKNNNCMKKCMRCVLYPANELSSWRATVLHFNSNLNYIPVVFK